jgi:hypothetical protein
MRTLFANFLLVVFFLGTSAVTLSAQGDNPCPTDSSKSRTELFVQSFKSFLTKVSTTTLDMSKKEQLAREYNDLIDEMDAMYHEPHAAATSNSAQVQVVTKQMHVARSVVKAVVQY